uniref:Uncharacterized protein n=1 Tax=Anguilla anguilla TaxID=7936 RepID=A0A0E9TTC0_ANGAN
MSCVTELLTVLEPAPPKLKTRGITLWGWDGVTARGSL